MGNQSIDYLDSDGIKRRVLLPSSDLNVEEGVPLSVHVDSIFEDVPIAFRRRLIEELYAVGLVEPADFEGANVVKRVEAAFRAALRQDVIAIINYAREQG